MKLVFCLLLIFFTTPILADNLSLGIPSKADFIVERQGYALGYNEYHEQAAWVSYILTKEEASAKEVQRKNTFKADPRIPTKSATPADYAKSGYDRGHLAPAGDMAWSAQAMDESFYMSNMSPQKPQFNRGIWKRLEDKIRKIAIKEKQICIVTGPILPKEKTITIGSNAVTVPTHYYKVVYDMTPPEKMIGFILPNDASNKQLRDFAVTVDDVEKVTGFDFFNLLPKQKQERLESTIDKNAWEV